MARDPGTRPFWVSAFLDFPGGTFDAAVAFWVGVTGFERSALRGDADEFATLVPGRGDDYLRVQRIRNDKAARLHLDIHVSKVPASVEFAVSLGAEVVADPGLGYQVLRSPGGLVFCLVTHPAAVRPPPATWPNGNRSVVDQVALDFPQDIHDAEAVFWAALIDAPVTPLKGSEFHAIDRRPDLPLRLLVHRLDDETGPAGAHLDLATDDRSVEVARHRELGADYVGDGRSWTVLRDPAGLHYCVTDRTP